MGSRRGRRRRGPGRVRQGVRGTAPVPGGRGVPGLAADHRPERDPEPVPQPRAPGGAGGAGPGCPRSTWPSTTRRRRRWAPCVASELLARGAAAADRTCARWSPAGTCWSCPRPRRRRRCGIPAGTVKSRLHRALTMLRTGGGRWLSPTHLDAELRALGRTLVVAPPARRSGRAGARPAAGRAGSAPLAAGRWLLTRRRRLVAAIIALVIIGLGLTPPVRAAVVEWLRIGGVLIRTAPAGRPGRRRPRRPRADDRAAW